MTVAVAGTETEKTVPTFEITDNEKSLYQENLPAMTEMTFCFWLTLQSTLSWQNFILSIATPGRVESRIKYPY